MCAAFHEKAVNYEMKFTSVFIVSSSQTFVVRGFILVVKQWYQASIRNRRRDLYHFCDGVALIDPVFHSWGGVSLSCSRTLF